MRRGIVFVAFCVHKFAVDPIGSAVFAFEFGCFRIIDQWMPHIAFLSSKEFPGAESGVITFTATMKVVVVICDHV